MHMIAYRCGSDISDWYILVVVVLKSNLNFAIKQGRSQGVRTAAHLPPVNGEDLERQRDTKDDVKTTWARAYMETHDTFTPFLRGH